MALVEPSPPVDAAEAGGIALAEPPSAVDDHEVQVETSAAGYALPVRQTVSFQSEPAPDVMRLPCPAKRPSYRSPRKLNCGGIEIETWIGCSNCIFLAGHKRNDDELRELMKERRKPIFEAGANNECRECGKLWKPGLVLRSPGKMQWKILGNDFKQRPIFDRQNKLVKPGVEFEWCNGNRPKNVKGNAKLAKGCRTHSCTYVHEDIEKILWQTPCGFIAADGHCPFEGTQYATSRCPMQHSPREYKTKLCTNYLGLNDTCVGYCKYGKTCLYLHPHDPDWKAKGYKTEPDPPSLRPIETPTVNFRTKTCHNWKYGICTFGPACWFAHTDEPERKGAVGDYNLTSYRKYLCKWSRDPTCGCLNGQKCKWYHEDEHEPWTRGNPFYRCQECPLEAHDLCRMQTTCSLFHPSEHEIQTINHAGKSTGTTISFRAPHSSWTMRFDHSDLLLHALEKAQTSDTRHRLHSLHVIFFRTERCCMADPDQICPDYRSDLFNQDITKHFCFDDHQPDYQPLRRKPITADGSLAYTSDLCRDFELGRCAAGDRCTRAHGHLERQYHPHRYKRHPCQAWERQSNFILGRSQQSSGGCPMGIRCPEKHGDDDEVASWWRSLRCESSAAHFPTSVDRGVTTQNLAKGQWQHPMSQAADPVKRLPPVPAAFDSRAEISSVWGTDECDSAASSPKTESFPALCPPCNGGNHPWLRPIEKFRKPSSHERDAVHTPRRESDQTIHVLRGFKLIECDNPQHRAIAAELRDPNDSKKLLQNDTLRTCFRWHSDADERRNPYNVQQQLCYDERVCVESQVSSNPIEFCAARCTDGRQCPCCKTTTELLYHPRVFKTRMCELENCAFTQHPHLCPYAHEIAELRSVDDLGNSNDLEFSQPKDQELTREASVMETSSILEQRVSAIQEDLNKFIHSTVGSKDIRQQGGVNPVDEFRREIEDWAQAGLVVPYTAHITERKIMSPIHHAPNKSSIVFEGTLQAHSQALDVAVKCYPLKRQYQDSTRPLWKDCHDILDEAYKLHSANVSRNDNIVEFFGLCLQPYPDFPFGIITRYFPGHDIEAYMQRDGHTVKMHAKLAIAVQAARGLKYLHDCHLIHCDVKGTNFLVDLHTKDKPRVAIADLGISRLMEANGSALVSTSNNVQGTRGFLAPELCGGDSLRKSYSKSADVYGFGITMWQILLLPMGICIPFGPNSYGLKYIKYDSEVEAHIRKGGRPTLPGPEGRCPKTQGDTDAEWEKAYCNNRKNSEQFWKLDKRSFVGIVDTMRLCWKQKDCDRPDMRTVCSKLEKLNPDALADLIPPPRPRHGELSARHAPTAKQIPREKVRFFGFRAPETIKLPRTPDTASARPQQLSPDTVHLHSQPVQPELSIAYPELSNFLEAADPMCATLYLTLVDEHGVKNKRDLLDLDEVKPQLIAALSESLPTLPGSRFKEAFARLKANDNRGCRLQSLELEPEPEPEQQADTEASTCTPTDATSTPVNTWTVQILKDFLIKLDLPKIASKVESGQIDGATAQYMEKDDWKEELGASGLQASKILGKLKPMRST